MNNTDKQFMFEFNFHEYGSIDAKDYEKEKNLLLIELAKLQKWVIKNKRKIAVVFEGRDTAGKQEASPQSQNTLSQNFID